MLAMPESAMTATQEQTKFQFLRRLLPEQLPISVETPAIRIQNPKNDWGVTMATQMDARPLYRWRRQPL
jgi:hypothetical protein